MKHISTFIVLTIISVPCFAQWNYVGINEQVIAIGVCDTTLFISQPGSLLRYTPSGSHLWVEADGGIDFSQGNITTFASLGRYFFCAPNTDQVNVTTDNGSHWIGVNAASPFCSNGTYLFGELYPPSGAYIIRSRIAA